MYYLLLIILFIFLIFFSELLAYWWHKWGAHKDIIPQYLGIQETHKKHHTVIGDTAYGDFFYILLFLIVYLFLVIYLLHKNIISSSLALTIYAPVAIVSFYNYFLHSAYHTNNHWLNKYEWFKNDKRIHFQHHRDDHTNYGIVTHFSDIVFDTFDYGLLKDL
jgi:phosphatidylglycerophosphate synthase